MQVQQGLLWKVDRVALGGPLAACVAALLVCGTANAQGVEGLRGGEHATPAMRTQGRDGGLTRGGADEPPPILVSAGPGARLGLNLEASGWLTAFSSVGALGMALSPQFNCRRGRIGLLPGLTFGVGVSIGILGTVLRRRGLRDVPRTRVLQRQRLFRAPWARGLGLALQSMATFGTTFALTAVGADVFCSD